MFATAFWIIVGIVIGTRFHNFFMALWRRAKAMFDEMNQDNDDNPKGDAGPKAD